MTTSLLLDRIDCTRLPEGIDLDTCTNLGNYYIPSTPVARSARNIPVQKPGRLTVLTIMTNVIMQIYDANFTSTVGRFWRIKPDAEFRPWVRIPFIQGVTPLLSYASEYPSAEGFCITNRYLYFCNIKDNSNQIVYKYDRYSLKKKDELRLTGTILRHGNDFTWNGRDKEVYCATAGGTKTISVLTEEFGFKRKRALPFDGITSLAGISYDPISGLIAVYGGASHKIFILNSIDDDIPLVTITHDENMTMQGIAFYDSLVYGIYSTGKIKVLNLDGDTIQNVNLGDYGECENISVRDDKIYFNAIDNEITTLYSADKQAIFSITGVI